MAKVNEHASPRQISASTNCIVRSTAGSGKAGISGIFVSAASATPTITVYDSASNTTSIKIVDTFTPVSGQYYPMPFDCNFGIYVAISGTVSCTVGTVAE